jgi:hypothetical protein
MKATVLFLFICFVSSSILKSQDSLQSEQISEDYAGVIKGEVRDADNNEGIPFATVKVLGLNVGTTTDGEGNYSIENLQPGVYDIEASYLGYRPSTQYEIQVQSSRPVRVDFTLVEATENLEEVVVKASSFRDSEESPLSLRTIGVTEIKRSPGGNRDISRVVQSLPGVAATSTFRNDLIIRGGAPNENRFYLDDVEVPNINHFATQGATGGPAGIINVDFIREVDFYSGAFPANRGNALSSVLNFKQKNGRDDRLGATATLGASDIGISLEGPLGENTTFIASARRSYLQLLFSVLGLPFLPTYNDFQTKIRYRPNNKNEFYFTGIGAIDNFSLNLDANETANQRFILNNIPINKQWTYTNGLVYKRYSERGYWTFVLSRNMLNNTAVKYLENDDSDPDNLLLDYRSREIENKFRVENITRWKKWKLNAGAGYQFVKYDNSTFNRVFRPQGTETIEYFTDINFQKYALFGQISRQLLNSSLSTSFGVRWDGNTFSDKMSNPLPQFSPRLSLSYLLSPNWRANFNTGIYYQLPPYTALGYQEDGEFINRRNGIGYVRSDHIVAGLEYNTSFKSRITIEGYYKKYSNYPFSIRRQVSIANFGNNFGVVGNEPLTPEGEGRSYGMEVLFQQRLYRGFYGVFAYTLGWTEFKDTEGEYIPTTWDSRHIVTTTLGRKFNNDWEVGLRWRFQSGLPFTPFDSQSNLRPSWDLNRGGVRDFSRINSMRTGYSNILDLRVDKKWFFKNWSLNVYADIQNILADAIDLPGLILNYEEESDGSLGDPIIENPNAPYDEQRYRTQEVPTGSGSLIPIIGIVVII